MPGRFSHKTNCLTRRRRGGNSMPTIRFTPSGKTIDVSSGTRLIDACRQAGWSLSAPCGGKGLCGKCRVLIVAGGPPADQRQKNCLPERFLAEGWRAACIIKVERDLTIADPDRDENEGVILTDFLAREPVIADNVWERDLVLDQPSASDQRDDRRRLAEALRQALPGGDVDIPLELVAALPGLLRKSGFRCRARGLDATLLALHGPDQAEKPALGLAVDIGTTTLVAALCDLGDGAVLGVVSKNNPQAAHGDDVVSRIDYAGKDKERLLEMRRLIVEAVADLSREACERHARGNAPLLLAVGSNTVMNHLLLGVSPKALALSPFIPAFCQTPLFAAKQIGWPEEDAPFLYIVPNVAAYVGGDIVAGMLAHDIENFAGCTLFIDVGTNGEIALAVDGKIYACATAAGPAFEGARISRGMRAVTGAIAAVEAVTGDLEVGVVDQRRPARGLCGTGLLDAVSALLKSGVVDESGRILDQEEAAETGKGYEGVVSRIHEDDSGLAVWLERPDEFGGEGVALTQRDVREFQLAKGAIAAGVRVLLGVAGRTPENVDQVLLAGGFGNYLNPASALAAGLLPAGIGLAKVRSVGNASLAGTRLCLLSGLERQRAENLARRVEYVELSGREDFQIAFAEEMLFPEQ